MDAAKSFRFINKLTHVEEKSGSFYVVGPISSVDLDAVKDIVTLECLEDMKAQIDSGSIKLDIDHEVFRKPENDDSFQPLGKAVGSWIEEGKLFVKWLLNDAHPRFKEMLQQIKNGFYDGFSIAFRPVEAVKDAASGIRYLKKLILENVGITAYPINKECMGAQVVTKSLEGLFMANYSENKEVPKVDAKPTEEKKPEAKSTEAAADPVVAQLKADLDAVKLQLEGDKGTAALLKSLDERMKQVEELKAKTEKAEKETEELKGQLAALTKSMNETAKLPMATDGAAAEVKSQKPQEPLSLIQ